MNEILEEIRTRVRQENLCDSCEESGCKASMDGVPFPRVIVDANKAFPSHKIEGKRCDCILFFMNIAEDMLITVPIELKSGSVDTSEAFEQLQRGADFVSRFAPEVPSPICCLPVLIHDRGMHKKQFKVLNVKKVNFGGTPMTIETARCDDPKNLASALKRSLRSFTTASIRAKR